MLKKVLIANRGEIALRIIYACKELGIKSVAVYSEADKDSLHVLFADEAVCIGPPSSKDSYLNIPSIISAAEITGADAIHPGYGFLAENAKFAEIVAACGIKWIGPPHTAISAMGDKSKAREIAKSAGVPVIPGSEGKLRDINEALRVADKIGFPVILKASAGGGGRGMRVCRSAEELRDNFITASQEAKIAFGDSSLYLEKFIENPRHVEIQVISDKYGNFYHLNERDCSVQRRHQKLIEEAPSPVVTPELRVEMGEAGIKLAKAVDYENAATVEFLVDGEQFYFMEMNTRIQVEHPVTEMITGVDIVKMQLKIAAGERIDFLSTPVPIHGHAIECRINAEDPFNFIPSPGKVNKYVVCGGPGVRIDGYIYDGYKIPPYYDSLIVKVITHGEDRREAIERMKRVLELTIIDGIKTTIPLHLKILNSEKFVSGEFGTRFMDEFLEKI